jgi:hypothetical protein
MYIHRLNITHKKKLSSIFMPELMLSKNGTDHFSSKIQFTIKLEWCFVTYFSISRSCDTALAFHTHGKIEHPKKMLIARRYTCYVLVERENTRLIFMVRQERNLNAILTKNCLSSTLKFKYCFAFQEKLGEG